LLEQRRTDIEADMRKALGDDAFERFMRLEELTEYWDPVTKSVVSVEGSRPEVPAAGQIS
jgi:hypothetical protein